MNKKNDTSRSFFEKTTTNHLLPRSFEFFFLLLVLWVVQTQVLLQIIVNRISLLLHHPRRVRAMKWAVAAYVGVINVSVFCIWVPAQLQRSRAYVDLNHVWDRVEKVLFMLLDAGLNVYFMWLVYSSLIANGLRKYRVLFWVNVGLDCVSIFLDVRRFPTAAREQTNGDGRSPSSFPCHSTTPSSTSSSTP